MKRLITPLFLLLSLAGTSATTLFPGCASTQVESRFHKGLDSLGLQEAWLRLINVERAGRFSLLIEAAADSIIEGTSDPLVKRSAHEWKLYTIPTFRQILFFPDPAAASLDGWAFAVQLRQFFTVGEGRSLFGTQQETAVRTVRKIESDFIYTPADSEGVEKFERMKQKAESWSAKNPITGPLYERVSVVPDLKEFQVDIDHGLSGTLGDIALDIRAISTRMDLLAAQLPREAAWQVEYLMSELGVPDRLDSLDRSLATITGALVRLTTVIESGDLTLDIRSLRTLHSDIMSIQEIVRLERDLVLADVSRQRMETLARVDAVADRVLSQATANATGLIDHLLWRITLLLAVCGVGVVVLVLAYATARKRGLV